VRSRHLCGCVADRDLVAHVQRPSARARHRIRIAG
jgi:hypothetical protein